jgi:tetratricopeptide (TPR) repeat protein
MLEVYDNQYDQEQIDEVKEIVSLYDAAKIEEALTRAKDHLARLRTHEKVEIHSAYNLAYHLSRDEFMDPEVKSFCRDVFEFLSDFVHPVGASATNSYVFSFLLHEEKFDLAEDLLRRAVSWNFGFESLNALSNLGQILYRKRDFFKAEAIFTYVRMSNVGHMRPEANYWLGRIYSETARPEQAALVWKEVSQVNSDSYQELAKGCLGGEIPKTNWIGESAVAQLIPNPIAPNLRIPESLPNLELAKELLINHFPGLKFDSPFRVRYDEEIADGIGNVARFLDVLSANDFSSADSVLGR